MKDRIQSRDLLINHRQFFAGIFVVGTALENHTELSLSVGVSWAENLRCRGFDFRLFTLFQYVRNYSEFGATLLRRKCIILKTAMIAILGVHSLVVLIAKRIQGNLQRNH